MSQKSKMVPPLSVKELLVFLSKFSEWSLERRHGKYKLEFKVGTRDKYGTRSRTSKPKHRQVGRSRVRIDEKILNALVKESQDKPPAHTIFVPPCCPATPTLAIPNHMMRQRHSSFGTVDSCDGESLQWDDYDVEKEKNLNPFHIERQASLDNVSIAESDVSDVSTLGSASPNKEGSPDNMREGRLLLREMKELRREIKKMGDASTIAMPTKRELLLTGCPITSELITDKENSPTSQEIQELLKNMDKDDSKMWDSGYLEGSIPSPTESIPSLEEQHSEIQSHNRLETNEKRDIDIVTNQRQTNLVDPRNEQDKSSQDEGNCDTGKKIDASQHDRAESWTQDHDNDEDEDEDDGNQGPFLIGQLNLLTADESDGEEGHSDELISNDEYDQSKVVQDIVHEKYANIRKALLEFAQPKTAVIQHNKVTTTTSSAEKSCQATSLKQQKEQRQIPNDDLPQITEDKVTSEDQGVIKKLSKNQKKKLKKRQKAQSDAQSQSHKSSRAPKAIRQIEPVLVPPQRDLSSLLNSTPFLGSIESDNSVDQLIANVLSNLEGGALSESDFEAQLLRKIVLNTSRDTSFHRLRQLIYRDLFEWEVGFCENEQRFIEVMGRKIEANQACLGKYLPQVQSWIEKNSQESNKLNGTILAT
ncbi:uncharacterized protein LOC131886467 isoform X1 [Tigriopus californicus]|uniref:uncharacterized protein LOC131886467 isoform X1 n=1 Tax=Tigriopus californicus TaxID=6832 RepID=UPI0027D9CFF1|nr:uncharacterized protein LOC131886467 isoform X1 [Tigriopus californicus]